MTELVLFVMLLLVAPFLMGIRLLQGSDAKQIDWAVISCKIICVYVLYLAGKFFYVLYMAGDNLNAIQRSNLVWNIVITFLELGFWVAATIFLSRPTAIEGYKQWCQSRPKDGDQIGNVKIG